MNIVRGDDYTGARRLVITVTDPAGAAVDLTGTAVKFMVKAHPTDADAAALISKSTTSGIALADQVASKGVAYLTLTATDTNIAPDAHWYEIQATDSLGVITLASGRFWVTADLIRT